jgi:bifunctional UDP-N-acetylglucosamine pyrophosphorylase / glucosamine-1-phosphate N-acetyltransferase
MKTVAMVLAAGKGTRMISQLPKVLHPACGQPMLSWVVDAVGQIGVSHTIVVVGHGADQVRAMLQRRYGSEVATALQTDLRGTGQAALAGLPLVPDDAADVLLVYGDTPMITPASLQKLCEARRQEQAAVALWTTKMEHPTGYGRIVRMGQDVVAIVEEKDATAAQKAITEVNPGVYCVEAGFLRTALAQLQPNNAQGEYYLTDVVGMAVANKRRVIGVAVPREETDGVNDRVQLSAAGHVLRRRIVRTHQLHGVSFVDDTNVWIDAGVTIGMDVVIEPGVRLAGNTRIGAGVVIGQGSVISDSSIADGVVIKPYTVCEQAVIGERSVVGPFARLRPEAVLLEDAHVGNFVELKKTTLGRGSKANHLAYLGDATIGAGVNVGAGTITCNYDGVAKHRTELADGVFIGSNSTLVAPLQVGQDAYVAAGSVLTDNVPADALARQANKEGHARVLRAAQRGKPA